MTAIEASDEGLRATFEGDKAPEPQVYDRILARRRPPPERRAHRAENAGVRVDERGFIPVDRQMRTNVPHIFAIGDIVGEPMLAHKATHEGKVAAEVIAGHDVAFDARAIPSVAYTDPEVAWMGLTETEAKAQGVAVREGRVPVGRVRPRAGDRARRTARPSSSSTRTHAACSAPASSASNAGELIAEAVLAIEMGADAEDIGLTIHPHPTLSETIGFAAEAAEGTITDLYMPKRAPKRAAVPA